MPTLGKKLFGKFRLITVVSGLPRSGTSMMMRILERAGIHPMVDDHRKPDEDNPKGYYEFERVKQLPAGDTTWLKQATGKSIKVIAFLLEYLPATYEYDVIIMRRAMPEILSSQREMLERRGESGGDAGDEEMGRLFETHLAKVTKWARGQRNMRVIEIDYNKLIAEPQPQLEALARFLGKQENIEAMTAAIDPRLYRKRGG